MGAAVDLAGKRVRVDDEPALVDPSAIATAIEEAGYPVG